MTFTALEDFWSAEANSQYCAGLSYTVNKDELRRLVRKWTTEGKVKLGRPAAELSGKGVAE